MYEYTLHWSPHEKRLESLLHKNMDESGEISKSEEAPFRKVVETDHKSRSSEENFACPSHSSHPTNEVIHSAAVKIPVVFRWGMPMEHLAQAIRLHERCFPIEYSPDYYKWLLQSLTLGIYIGIDDYETLLRESGGSTKDKANRPLPSFFYDMMKDSVLSLLEPKDILIGCISGQLTYCPIPHFSVKKENAPPFGYFVNPAFYIASFAVDSEFRGCGLGSALLDHYMLYVTKKLPIHFDDFLHHRVQVREPHSEDASSKHEDTSTREQGSDTPLVEGTETKLHAIHDCYPLYIQGLGGAAMRFPGFEEKKTFNGNPSTFMDLNSNSDFIQPQPELAEQSLYTLSPASRAIAIALEEARLRSSTLFPNNVGEGLSDAGHIPFLVENTIVQYGVDSGVWLHCLFSDTDVLNFYHKRGFEVAKVIPDYYCIENRWESGALLSYEGPLQGQCSDSLLRDGLRENARTIAAVIAKSTASRSPCTMKDTKGNNLTLPTWWMFGPLRQLIENVDLEYRETCQQIVENSIIATRSAWNSTKSKDREGGMASGVQSKLKCLQSAIGFFFPKFTVAEEKKFH